MSLDPTLDQALIPEKKEAPIPSIPIEEEPKSTILIWAIVIIAVLVIGIFALNYWHVGKVAATTEHYNQWQFERQNGMWQTIWQKDNVQLILDFHYLPQATENITTKVLPSWNPDGFATDQIIIAFDPRPEDQTYMQLAASELAFKLTALGVNITTGYTVNATGDYPERPIVNCATKNVSIIVLNNVNITPTMVLQDRCITLSGYNQELLRATDRVMYTFYGIIPSLQP